MEGEDDDEDDDDDEEEDMDDDEEDDEDELGMEGHQFQDAHEHLSHGKIISTSLSALGTTITRVGEGVGTPGTPSSRSGVLVMQHTPILPSLASCSTSSSNSSSSPSTSTTTTTNITTVTVTASSSSSSSSPPSSSTPSPSSSSSPSPRGDSSRDCPMDLSVRRGGGGGGGPADKGAPHRPSFLPVLSRPSLLESSGLAASPSTPIREHPSEILSPVTESSSLLKSIYQTTERAAQVSSVVLDPSTESGSSRSMLHAYLRERAVRDTAIKRQQYSFSSDAPPGSPHLPPGEPKEQGKGAPHEGKDRERITPPAPLSITSNTTSTITCSTTFSSSAIIVTSSQVSSSASSSTTSRMPTPPANLTVMNSGGGLDTKTAFLVPSGVVPSSLNR